jgi:hypothetical protein
MTTLKLTIAAGIPPRDNHAYYGDRYSVVVLLATGHLARWDNQNHGWVDAGWREGPSPSDYRDHGFPTGRNATRVEWVLSPKRSKRLWFSAPTLRTRRTTAG